MTVAAFYPYRTGPEFIGLHIEPDGLEVPRGADGALHVYREELSQLTIQASMAVPDDLWSVVLPPNEQERKPAELLVTLWSIESRRRESVVPKGDGVYEVTIPLNLMEWAGTVELQAVLVRTERRRSDEDGFATEPGARLAWSETRRLVLEQPPLPPGAFLEVRWRRFSDGNSWLRQHRTHLFALDNETSPPTVLLNEEIPGARAILESRGTHGWKARVRDATYYQIAHQVWSSLLASCLSDLANTVEEGIGADLDAIAEWEKDTLQAWAPRFFPEMDREASVDALLRFCVQDREELLISRMPNAVQENLSTSQGFEGMARELTRP